MLGVSKLCSPRPKARDVLLSWARASAYEDRAVEYLKSADLAPDRTVQNRFIAFARHYRTLAQIERRVARETSPQTRLSQSPIDQNRSGSLTSFAFVLLIIISGATTTVPLDLARASDCLAAPNSPAPKGSHWHYHLNRATQQKCWYVRSSEKQPQQATTQTTSTSAAVPSTSAGQIGSTGAHDIDRSSRQPEPSTAAIQEPASGTMPNGSASQPSPPENRQAATALRENASSDANGQPTVPTAEWPDPPPITPSVNAGEAIAATASDDPVYPVTDTTDSVSRNGQRTSTFEIPIAIFPAFAFGLVVIGFAVRFLMKDAAPRPAQEVDQTAAVTTLDDDDHIKSPENRLAEPTSFGEGDFQSFVSAVSSRGPLERIVGSVHPANEISAREARLAQLRENIGQRLGWIEPTRQYSSKRKVAS